MRCSLFHTISNEIMHTRKLAFNANVDLQREMLTVGMDQFSHSPSFVPGVTHHCARPLHIDHMYLRGKRIWAHPFPKQG